MNVGEETLRFNWEHEFVHKNSFKSALISLSVIVDFSP